MLGCYADVGVDSFVTPRPREATSAMGMRFVTVGSGRIDCRIVFDPSHAPDGQGIAYHPESEFGGPGVSPLCLAQYLEDLRHDVPLNGDAIPDWVHCARSERAHRPRPRSRRARVGRLLPSPMRRALCTKHAADLLRRIIALSRETLSPNGIAQMLIAPSAATEDFCCVDDNAVAIQREKATTGRVL